MKNYLKWIALTLVLLMATLLGSELQAQSATQAEIEAILAPQHHSRLALSTEGRVAEIFVSEGEQVTVGDPILRIEAPRLQTALANAQADLAITNASLAIVQADLLLAEAELTITEFDQEIAQANLALLVSEPLTQAVTISQEQIEAAEANLALAQAQRNVALTVATPAQIQKAQADVAAAQANVYLIQQEYDDIIEQELLGATEEEKRQQLQAAQVALEAAQIRLNELNAGPTAAQYQAANAGVTVAQARIESANADLALLLAPVTPQEITQAEIEIAQTETAVQQAQLNIQQKQQQITSQEIAVQQAETAVQQAELAIEQTILLAPFSGTIADLTIEVGENISAGQPVGQIANFDQWVVETIDLTEFDVVDLDVGDTFDIYLEALPQETIEATISEIDFQAGTFRGDVTYQVTLQLDSQQAENLPVRWGMTSFVRLDS